MSIDNLATFDPFADIDDGGAAGGFDDETDVSYVRTSYFLL